MITITVLGLEDVLCRAVLRRVAAVVVESDVRVVVEIHTDFEQMIARGAYAPPAVLIDGVLKSVGRLPDRAELRDWLSTGQVR
jgi:hypothetical protein